MIYNDTEIGLEKVDAFYITRKHSANTYIEMFFKTGMHITFTFNNKEFDPRMLEKNKIINLIEYLYWDVTLVTNETYYLFDLTKDIVNLTRIDDNLFNIKVNIKDPDIIYSPSNENFKNLIIDLNFSFIYTDD